MRINGYGAGTFNGNGDEWYTFIRKQPNTSNYPGRPHAVTFNGLTNSVVKGLNFLRSQMWYVMEVSTAVQAAPLTYVYAGPCPSFILITSTFLTYSLITLETLLKAVRLVPATGLPINIESDS